MVTTRSKMKLKPLNISILGGNNDCEAFIDIFNSVSIYTKHYKWFRDNKLVLIFLTLAGFFVYDYEESFIKLWIRKRNM